MSCDRLPNQSLHWIFTPLRSAKTSEFNRYKRLNMPTLKFSRKRIIIIIYMFLFVLLPLLMAYSAQEEKNITNSNNSGESSFRIKPYIQPGLTIVGFAVGFGIIIFQLNRQHKNSLKLQRQQFKAKIQQEIFNDISDGIYQSTNAYVKLSSKLLAVRQKIDTTLFLKNEGINPKPLSERTDDYIDYHHSFSESIVELIFILEKYVITDRIFEIFNMALQSVSYDLDKYYQNVNDSLLKFLPIDVPKEKQQKLGVYILEPKQKSENDFDTLKKDISNYNNKLMDITCYLHDLKIEAQNILLGDIFENTVSPRKPNDREYVVVSKSTNRSLDELERYFMHETEWGKNWQMALKRAVNEKNS